MSLFPKKVEYPFKYSIVQMFHITAVANSLQLAFILLHSSMFCTVLYMNSYWLWLFPIKALEDELSFVWMKCSCLILMHSRCMSKNYLKLERYFLKTVKYLHSIFDGLNVQTRISFPVVLWVRSRSCLLDV